MKFRSRIKTMKNIVFILAAFIVWLRGGEGSKITLRAVAPEKGGERPGKGGGGSGASVSSPSSSSGSSSPAKPPTPRGRRGGRLRGHKYEKQKGE